MTSTQIRDLLTNLQRKSALPAVQTSTHSPPPTLPDAELPSGTTHVFVKNHKTQGLDPSWSGPFPVMEKISRSQIRIKVGLSKEGNVRSEVRRLQDVKPAHLAEGVQDAERPRRGRKPRPSPPKSPDTRTSEAANSNAVGVNKQENPPKVASPQIHPPNSNVSTNLSPSGRPLRSSRKKIRCTSTPT